MKYDFPKIDLHLHLDGSMLPESAWEMAKERNVKMPADNLEDFKKFIVVTADCRSVNEYLEKFELPLQIMQDKEAISRTAREPRGLCTPRYDSLPSSIRERSLRNPTPLTPCLRE